MAAESGAAASGSSASTSGPIEFAKFNYAFSSSPALKHQADNWLEIAEKMPKDLWLALFNQRTKAPDNHRASIQLEEKSADQRLLAEQKLHTRIQQARAATDAAFRQQLQALGIDCTHLHTAVLKLLYTASGAEEQAVHFDLQVKADQCYGVLLYLNGPTTSTAVPSKTAAEMQPLWWKGTNAEADEEKFASLVCAKKDEFFCTRQVNAGDALFFRGDVAHFGPKWGSSKANVQAKVSRFVLYALFSPDASSTQDDFQVLPLKDA